MEIILDPNKRWELGLDHHPKSIKLYRHIDKVDFEHGDYFYWKSGGDGDNGEQLMYLMDSFFELEDKRKEQEELFQ
ncbi:hypothetical protein JNUCC42_04305 [Brevibacterium sp. JNUCC-42]|nr:hypothetical protein JNUCC42_04305 [Brevibacterium sp. JNUCC-42]